MRTDAGHVTRAECLSSLPLAALASVPSNWITVVLEDRPLSFPVDSLPHLSSFPLRNQLVKLFHPFTSLSEPCSTSSQVRPLSIPLPDYL